MDQEELKNHILQRCSVSYAREDHFAEEQFTNIGFNISSLSRYIFLKDIKKTKCRVWGSDLTTTENWRPKFYPLKVGNEAMEDDWKFHDHLIVHAPLILKSSGEYRTRARQ